jgi:CopG family nickel-responsive transcriptional regulator
MGVVRFGVSLDKEIMDDLDNFVAENHFPNRSQGIRSLIEKYTVDRKWQCDNEVAGAIVIVYDHHHRNIDQDINAIQHDYHHLILSTQHVHLTHETCLETIVVRGRANELTSLADQIIALKGIHHGRLVMSRT